MELAHFQETIGRVLADGDVFIGSGASVEVRDETNGALAAIFVDRDGVTPKSNPFNADSQGFADFYVATGRYRVKVSINGDVTLDLRDVEVLSNDISSRVVTTSTGTQTLVSALDQRGPVFDTVSDMDSAANLTVGIKCRTLGYNSVGDGGEAYYQIVSSGSGTSFGFLFEQLSGSGLEAKLLTGGIMEDKTALIPTDYPTLQGAFDDLSKITPSNGARITLMVESGHAPASGLSISDGDYSQFIVSSEDAEVVLAAGWSAGTDIIRMENARGLTVDCLFDATSANVQRGIAAVNGSHVDLTNGSGVKNITTSSGSEGGVGDGLFVGWRSSAYGPFTVFTGNLGFNVRITHNSNGWLENLDASGGQGDSNIFVSRGSTAYIGGVDCSGALNDGIRIARSIVVAIPANAVASNFNNAGSDGAYVTQGSKFVVNLRDGLRPTFNDCANDGISADEASVVNARSVDILDSGRFSIFATTGATINAEDSITDRTTVSGDSCIRVDRSAVVNAHGGRSKNSGVNGLECRDGGMANVDGRDFNGAASYNIRGIDGCDINARESVCTGSGIRAIRADGGSRINIRAATLDNEVQVTQGSIVAAHSTTSATSISINTLTADGIIFR